MDVCKLPTLHVQSKLLSPAKLMFPDTDLRGRVWVLELDSCGLKTGPAIPRCVVWSKLLTQSPT